MRSKCDVHISACEYQRGTIQVVHWIEGKSASDGSIPRTSNRGGDNNWAAGLLCAARDVESVQTINVVAVLDGIRHEIDCPRTQIDNWSAGNSISRTDVRASEVATLHYCGARRCTVGSVNHTDLPQRSGATASIRIRIKRIQAVICCRNIQDVVSTLSWYRNIRNVKRLGIDRTVDRQRELLAECC